MAIYDIQNLRDYFEKDELVDRKLAAEEVLFHQGASTRSIHFVVHGEIRVETYLEDGRSIVFYRVQDGGALGEESLHFPEYLYTGVASVETTIRSISKTDFLERMQTNAKFSHALSSCLAQRYAHALMLRELISIKAAEDRLLTWLHWQSTQGEDSLDFKGRMGTLGPELGLSKESIYRAFARLKESGEIVIEDGRVALLKSPTDR